MIVSGLLSLIPVHYTTATHPSGFKGRQHIGRHFLGNALNTIVDTISGIALDTIVDTILGTALDTIVGTILGTASGTFLEIALGITLRLNGS